jgi:hypothetical protein
VQERLTLLAAHLGIGIAKNESNSGEEVALARAIASNNNVSARRKGLNNGLVLVAAACERLLEGVLLFQTRVSTLPFEALYDDLLDKHGRCAKLPKQRNTVKTSTMQIAQGPRELLRAEAWVTVVR